MPVVSENEMLLEAMAGILLAAVLAALAASKI
jgi:hypothetical protein